MMTQMMITKNNDDLYSEVRRHWIHADLFPSETNYRSNVPAVGRSMNIYLMYSVRADIDTDVPVIRDDLYTHI